MVNKVFKNQLRGIIEEYVDDMLVKSMMFEQHLLDLEEVFSMLNQYQIKLNFFKCVFSIKGGKLLGFLLSSKGIKSNPEKNSSHTEHESLIISRGISAPHDEVGRPQ
jgi:hypothetical protein